MRILKTFKKNFSCDFLCAFTCTDVPQKWGVKQSERYSELFKGRQILELCCVKQNHRRMETSEEKVQFCIKRLLQGTHTPIKTLK